MSHKSSIRKRLRDSTDAKASLAGWLSDAISNTPCDVSPRVGSTVVNYRVWAPLLTRRGPAARCRRPDRRHRPTAGPRDHLPNGARSMTAQENDPEVRGRRRFPASRVRVVRLNCCVLDVIDATLVVMILACLVALRTEGSRLAQDANSTHLSVAGERWFDKVLDCEPLDQPAASRDLDGRGARGPAAGARAACRYVSADHAGGPRDLFGDGARGRPGTVRGQYRRHTEPPAPAIVPAAALAGVQDTAAGMSPARRSTAPPPNRREVLPAAIRGPVSRSEMKAGAIIAAVLIIGVTTLCPGSRSRAGPRVGLQHRRRSVPAGGAGPTSCRSTRRFLDSDRALRAWRQRTKDGPDRGVEKG